MEKYILVEVENNEIADPTPLLAYDEAYLEMMNRFHEFDNVNNKICKAGSHDAFVEIDAIRVDWKIMEVK